MVNDTHTRSTISQDKCLLLYLMYMTFRFRSSYILLNKNPITTNEEETKPTDIYLSHQLFTQ